jgi:ERCC4-type nuclease
VGSNPEPLPVAIVIDRREQLPYAFAGQRTVVRKLDAGDYSLEGYEVQIAVERKSKADAWGCVGKGRGRFERSLERLRRVERPFVVIECNLDEFAKPPPYVQRITPATAVHSYWSWQIKYGVNVVWAPSRAWAEAMILWWFRKFLEVQGK